MAFTKRQTGVVGTATTGTTIVATLASNPTTGDLVCIGVLFYDGTTTPPTFTVKDGNLNSFTVESHNSGSTNMNTAGYVGQAYLVAPSNANKAITVTFSSAIGGAGALWVDDFAVSGGTATYDNGAVGSGTGAINTPTIPVSGASELLYCVMSDEASPGTINSPWVATDGGGQFGGNTSAYVLSVSANTAVDAAGSGANHFNAIGMSFLISAGAAAPVGKIRNTNQTIKRASYW